MKRTRFKEFLAHQASKEQIARQNPAKSEFSPLSFFGSDDDDEAEFAAVRAWLDAYDE